MQRIFRGGGGLLSALEPVTRVLSSVCASLPVFTGLALAENDTGDGAPFLRRSFPHVLIIFLPDLLIETPLSIVYMGVGNRHMNTWQETSKLVELRTKTDRQLVELIAHKLETATRLAQVREFHDLAERDCAEVSRLLPWVSRHDRRRLEGRLREVTAMLRPTQCAACF